MLNVSLIFRAIDRASSVIHRVNRALRLNQAQVRGLQAAQRHATAALGPLTGGLGALAAAAGLAGGARFLGNLEERLTRLGIQAEKPAEEINRLKEEVFAVAQAPQIRLNPAALLDAIDEIIEKTGDFDFAREQVRNLGLAIQATGGRGAELGALTAEMRKFGLTTKQDVLTAIDTLVRQGKAGAFTVGNLAGQGERLVSAYAATGRTGQKAVREVGAIIQVIRQGTGNAEQAVTAYEALLRTLQNADKIKVLKQNGIQIFEPDQPGVMRNVADIMQDIIKATGGDIVKISSVFDAEAIRAFNAAVAEFKRTGSIESLGKFLKITGDGQQTTKDSARAAGTFNAALADLGTTAQSLADNRLTGWLHRLSAVLNTIAKSPVAGVVFDVGLAIAGLAVAGKVLSVVWNLGMAAKGLLAFSGVTAAVGNFILALRAGYGAVAAFNLVLAANPIGLVITLIASLAGAAYLIYKNWAPISEWFSGLWDGFKSIVAEGVLWILEKVASLTGILPSSIRSTLGLDGIDREVERLRKQLKPGGKTLSPAAGAAAGAGRGQEFKGQLNIKIDSEGRPHVKELRSDNRNVDVDVDAGMVMGTP